MIKWMGGLSSRSGINIFPFLLVFLLSLIFLSTSVKKPESDGELRYKTFLSFSGEETFYTKYSTIQPYLTYKLKEVSELFGGDFSDVFFPKNIEFILFLFFSVLLMFFFKERNFLLIFLSLIPLSMFSHFSGQFFSEIFSSTLIAIGFLFFIKKINSVGFIILGAFFCSIGLANWYVLLVPFACMIVFSFFDMIRKKDNSKEFFAFLMLSSFLSVIMIVVELYIKNQLFDNPYAGEAEHGAKTLMPYSGLSGFSNPLIIGLLGSTLSFGKSIFLFNPFLIYLFIEKYKFKKYLVVSLLALLVVYSQWWSWYGGLTFGTRFYMVFIIPCAFIVAKRIYFQESLKSKLLDVIVISFSFWVAVCGKYFGIRDVAGTCISDNYKFEPFCWYVPEFSPLINPFVSHSIGGIIEVLSYRDMAFYFLILYVVLFVGKYRKS